MNEIYKIIEHVASLLEGTNAFIQIQVNDRYYSRRVGNINKLTDNPVVITQDRTSNFIDWMEEQADKRGVTEATRQNHHACIRLLRQYNNQLSFSNINISSILAFDRYLRDQHYKQNTIGKIMSILRTYVRQAIDNNLLTTDPFRKYKVSMVQTKKDILTEKDLVKIEKCINQLSGEELAVAKGFLFAVYTGLRYSDVSRVTRHDIKKIGRNEWLFLRMQKTGNEVRVPLSKIFGGKALSLVDKKKTRLFPMPSNAMCNIILDKVMKKCGIKKHITMHCARVTCATLCLSRGMPITSIQHILGHRDVKTTAKVYAQVTDTTLLKDVKKCWKANNN